MTYYNCVVCVFATNSPKHAVAHLREKIEEGHRIEELPDGDDE